MVSCPTCSSVLVVTNMRHDAVTNASDAVASCAACHAMWRISLTPLRKSDTEPEKLERIRGYLGRKS